MILFVRALVSIAYFFTVSASARDLPNPPADTPVPNINAQSVFSEMSSSAKLPASLVADHTVSFSLPDGTVVGGLLFVDPSQGVRPLLIGDYGLLSSRASPFNAGMIQKLVLTGKLNANLLSLDDNTGAAFLAENHNMGIGGYDSGRILVEVAELVNKSAIPHSSIHLIGESLGGLNVLEALLEDQRRGTHLFQSAITFSAAVKEAQLSAAVLAAYGHKLHGIDAAPISFLGKLFLFFDLMTLNKDMADNNLPAINLAKAGDTFYEQFQQRLLSLSAAPNWHPAVSRNSVEEYIQTSADLLDARISSLKIPTIMIHAQDDPLIDYSQFRDFAAAQVGNTQILTLGTTKGSHCGFMGAYGPEWFSGLINRAIALH